MMPNNPNLIAFEVEGTTFHVEIKDEYYPPPWEYSDGHGPVSEWTSRSKCPGEWVLDENRQGKRYYDFAEAMKIAKRDGWDAPPYGVGTKGERALRAVTADFKYLQGWCNGTWKYVCLHVMLLGDDEYGESEVLYDEYLGCVEYDYNPDGYWVEEAKTMASEILYEIDRQKSKDKINRRFKDAMECGL